MTYNRSFGWSPDWTGRDDLDRFVQTRHREEILGPVLPLSCAGLQR